MPLEQSKKLLRVKRLRALLWAKVLVAAPKAAVDIPMAEDIYHIMGTLHLATLLAEKRGVDTELATAAMLLHDIGRVVTGRNEGHAQVGAELARGFLAEAGYTPAERDAVCHAIETHIRKGERGTPLDEVVRDADVLEVYLSRAPLPEVMRERVRSLQQELGLGA